MQSNRWALASSLVILAVNGALAANDVTTSYSRPLSFEPNRGQADQQVEFLARGTGYGLLLSRAEAVLVFERGSAVRMRAVGANPSPLPEALDPQASKAITSSAKLPRSGTRISRTIRGSGIAMCIRALI